MAYLHQKRLNFIQKGQNESRLPLQSNNNNNNPHLNFLKGTVLEDKGQGGRDKGSRAKGQVIRPKQSLTLKTKSCSDSKLLKEFFVG